MSFLDMLGIGKQVSVQVTLTEEVIDGVVLALDKDAGMLLVAALGSGEQVLLPLAGLEVRSLKKPAVPLVQPAYNVAVDDAALDAQAVSFAAAALQCFGRSALARTNRSRHERSRTHTHALTLLDADAPRQEEATKTRRTLISHLNTKASEEAQMIYDALAKVRWTTHSVCLFLGASVFASLSRITPSVGATARSGRERTHTHPRAYTHVHRHRRCLASGTRRTIQSSCSTTSSSHRYVVANQIFFLLHVTCDVIISRCAPTRTPISP
jgi:hypothetical protein